MKSFSHLISVTAAAVSLIASTPTDAKIMPIDSLTKSVILAQSSLSIAAEETKNDPIAQANYSDLDSSTFYELLLAEFQAQNNDFGTGFSLYLAAAQRLQSSQLYERAVEMAIQGRASHSALIAAKSWAKNIPNELQAHIILLRLQLFANNLEDSVYPLQQVLRLTPLPQKKQAFDSVVPLYARHSADKKGSLKAVSEALEPWLNDPNWAAASWLAMGRMKFLNNDFSGAFKAAQKVLEFDAQSKDGFLLAIEVFSQNPKDVPEIESWIQSQLQKQTQADLSLAYARALINQNRYKDAQKELSQITSKYPDKAEVWLMLGALQVQHHQKNQAVLSLNRYIELVETQIQDESKSIAKTQDKQRVIIEKEPKLENKIETEADLQNKKQARLQGLIQAYLWQAQLAEKQKDFVKAQFWLNQIKEKNKKENKDNQDNQDKNLSLELRQASLFAAQGQLKEARDLIQHFPENTPEDARIKINAEAQLLRDHKQYQAAFDLLNEALKQYPDDVEIIYDQAMVADKLGRFDVMEQLLRKIIEREPKNQNAYNALGYSFADRGIRFDEARELINKALEFAPNDPFIMDSLAWLEFKSGQNAQALKILENAYQNRADPEIAAHLGEVLWIQNNRKRAEIIWKEGFENNPENETLLETIKRFKVDWLK